MKKDKSLQWYEDRFSPWRAISNEAKHEALTKHMPDSWIMFLPLFNPIVAYAGEGDHKNARGNADYCVDRMHAGTFFKLG